ncbi:Hypothetical protein SCF082_LOCUS24749, partial [Durusdinium trenchii]
MADAFAVDDGGLAEQQGLEHGAPQPGEEDDDPFQGGDDGFDAFGEEDERAVETAFDAGEDDHGEDGFGDDAGDVGGGAGVVDDLDDPAAPAAGGVDGSGGNDPAAAAADPAGDDDDDAALRAFERKFQAQAQEKDAKMQAQQAEMRQAAEKELQQFLGDRAKSVDDKKRRNREEEQELMNQINDTLTAENPWERIVSLVDMNADAEPAHERDTSRLKKMLIQLKNALEALLDGRLGFCELHLDEHGSEGLEDLGVFLEQSKLLAHALVFQHLRPQLLHRLVQALLLLAERLVLLYQGLAFLLHLLSGRHRANARL